MCNRQERQLAMPDYTRLSAVNTAAGVSFIRTDERLVLDMSEDDDEGVRS